MVLIAPDHVESGTGRLLKLETAAGQGAISGKYVVGDGDLVYSKIRPYLQKACMPNMSALCSADMYPLTPRHGVSGAFMLHVLLSARFTEFATSVSARSGIPKVNRQELSEFHFPLPPLEEQKLIAQYLDDADSGAAALKRLIAKKEAIKQGLMQELLTGRTRLPGFDGEWGERRLDDLATKIQDGTHFSPALGGAQFRYITSRNIGLGRMRLDLVDTISETEHRKIYARCDTAYGDLLLTKDGANTGNAAINPFHDEISLLSSVAFVRCDPAVAAEVFVMYYLLSHNGRQQVRDAMAGNAITRLTLAKIRDLSVPTPPVDEQRAIAKVLTDADDELTALRARLEKAKAIKQGMMQELLTGRTRLPVPRARRGDRRRRHGGCRRHDRQGRSEGAARTGPRGRADHGSARLRVPRLVAGPGRHEEHRAVAAWSRTWRSAGTAPSTSARRSSNWCGRQRSAPITTFTTPTTRSTTCCVTA